MNTIKTKTLLHTILLLFFLPPLHATVADTLNQSSGTISIRKDAYVNNMEKVWVINTGTNLPVKISFYADLDEGGLDYIDIFSLDNAGKLSEVYCAAGQDYGTISTIIPSGKAKIFFYSDGYASYDLDFTGFTLDFSVDNSFSVSDNSYVTGSSYVHGSSEVDGNALIKGLLNIGDIVAPAASVKLRVNGSIRGGGATSGAIKVQTNYGYVELGPQESNYSNFKTDQANYLFNKPIYLETGALSSYSATNLSLQTNGTPRMTVLNNNGNVGIGTTSPQYLLDARGLNSITSGGHDIAAFANVSGTAGIVSGWYANGTEETGGCTRSINSLPYFLGTTSAPQAITILNSGFVGIGTTAPDKLFTVKGVIHAQEVQVDVTGFADYVFEKGYKLKPLSEIHSFISENGHLPEIPSADEAKKNGINVADMQVMLLKKIEELTLYAIEQQKRIEALEKKSKEK